LPSLSQILAKQQKAKRIRQHVGTQMRDLQWTLREQQNRMDGQLRENLELTAQVERTKHDISVTCRRFGADSPEKLFEEFSKLTEEEKLGNFGSP
jgi:hypothetical protein